VDNAKAALPTGPQPQQQIRRIMIAMQQAAAPTHRFPRGGTYINPASFSEHDLHHARADSDYDFAIFLHALTDRRAEVDD
jgi:hypothetical protein